MFDSLGLCMRQCIIFSLFGLLTGRAMICDYVKLVEGAKGHSYSFCILLSRA